MPSRSVVRAEGEVRVVWRTPRCLATRIGPRFDLPVGLAVVALQEEWSRGQSGLAVFHDLAEVVDYEPAARDVALRWSRAHVHQFDEVHILVGSRLIAEMVEVLRAFADSRLRLHERRATFDEAEALRRRREGGLRLVGR